MKVSNKYIETNPVNIPWDTDRWNTGCTHYQTNIKKKINQQDATIQLRSFNSSKTPASSYWVNTTRYCEYSQVLLMMGENIARNM